MADVSVHAHARNRGLATRAVQLMCSFLVGLRDVDVAVLRIDERNRASLGVARRSGFEDRGMAITPEGEPVRCFHRRLRDP
jgi:RimJ/RimL family protein N-acetyltransferase